MDKQRRPKEHSKHILQNETKTKQKLEKKTEALEYWTPEKIKEQKQKIANFMATRSYFTTQSACKWCLTVYQSKYELGFSNIYTRYAYDTKLCKQLDAIHRGWKNNLVDEDELPD